MDASPGFIATDGVQPSGVTLRIVWGSLRPSCPEFGVADQTLYSPAVGSVTVFTSSEAPHQVTNILALADTMVRDCNTLRVHPLLHPLPCTRQPCIQLETTLSGRWPISQPTKCKRYTRGRGWGMTYKERHETEESMQSTCRTRP